MLCRKTARVLFLIALVPVVLYLGVATVQQRLPFSGTESLFGSSVVVPVNLYKEHSSLNRLPPPNLQIKERIQKLVKDTSSTTRNSSQEASTKSPITNVKSSLQSDVGEHQSTSSTQTPSAIEKITHEGNYNEKPSQDMNTETVPPVREHEVNNSLKPHVEVSISDQVTVSLPPTQGTPDPQSPIGTLPCNMPNCIDALDIREQTKVKQCEKQAIEFVGHALEEPTCKFIKGQKYRHPVALNSQEGSGNTWLRGLLERATGICTGFYLCDKEMRPRGFLGEAVQSGRVLVVKTHVHIPQWMGEKKIPMIAYDSSYGSAVYLIRHPAHGVITEWNRVVTLKKSPSLKQSHTNVISKDEFGTREWRSFFNEYLYKWKVRTENWVLHNDKYPVHVVSYEDLVTDRVREIEKILDFLKFPYDHDDLVEKISGDYTVFHRPHTHNAYDFQHFSPEEKEKLRTTIETALKAAKAHGKEHLFHFNDYLQSLPDIN